MSRAVETAAQRQARLAEIRRQIEAGVYETRERLAGAVDALLADFAGQPDGASEQSSEKSHEPHARWPRPK
jgi:hypothetical protein